MARARAALTALDRAAADLAATREPNRRADVDDLLCRLSDEVSR